MKTLKMILLSFMLVGVFTITGFAQADKVDVPEKFHAGTYDINGELIIVKAKGLVCEFCAKALEKVFMKQNEVSGIDVNLTTKKIFISLKEGMTLDEESVRKLITDAGYNISEMTRKNGTQ